jgi:hypothetical protein
MLAHGTGIAIGTDGHTLARREHRKKPFHVRHGRQRWKDAREHGSGVGKAATKSLSDGRRTSWGGLSDSSCGMEEGCDLI